MLILGLNAYHGDSSACLVEDGVLLTAAEEERFTRVKHWAGFPGNAVKWCLKQRSASLSDIDVVAVNRHPRANLLKKAAFVLRRRPDLKLIVDRIRNAKSVRSVTDDLERALPGQRFRGRLANIEHHRCHLASAFLVSPFDDAVCLSIDGFGDFASASWGRGQQTKINIDGQVLFPHSLGIFYQAITQFLGFPHYGDEYKVMGLAPYGKPDRIDDMRKIVRLQSDGRYELQMEYFKHGRERVAFDWDNGSPAVGQLYTDTLRDLLGPPRAKGDPLNQRHHDLARSAQAMYEEALFHLLDRLYEKYATPRLALAGGCANNSVANGKISRMTPFSRVYVQSAAGDAGGAIGAALTAWHEQSGGVHEQRKARMDHAHWGPEYSATDVREALAQEEARLPTHEFSITWHESDDALCEDVAAAIAKGSVVGWFQGRMEWGPRALGNRSILGDPRRSDMKEILNLKIKRRESFRPFAPSVLREHVADWFEEDAEVPFMMKVFQIKEHQRAKIPAVTHVDGSGRLQTVTKSAAPLYHQLISTFARACSVPMVLNTSFNENEPVVCTPSEALDCFLRTKMDVLALGRCVVRRTEA